MIENKVNEYGQEQVIDNFDRIIKIGNKFLQVRLIKTKKWREKDKVNGKFTEPMPRAKFVDPTPKICYLVNREDLIKMKEGVKK